jgi:membrane associated rhomboid family serine protease
VEQSPSEPKFRPCPSCGNLIPANVAQCEYCGARSADAIVEEGEAALTRNFIYALFTRPNPFTFIFIGVNVGVFVLMSLAGGMSLMSTDDVVLREFGAKVNSLIDQQHEYWRFVTSIFIHIGLIHLLLNNYALWIIGQEIERIYGSARFVLLYLVTGVIGSLCSYYFKPEAISAGASGAIFGLFGVMATFAFKYRNEIPAALRSEIKRRIIPIIFINLAFGFSVRIVDNSAHIGGLLSGVALALVIPYKRPHERGTSVVWRTLQVICLAVILISFVAAFRNYGGPPPSLANLSASPDSINVKYFKAMNDASAALVQSVRSFGTFIDDPSQRASGAKALEGAERGIGTLGQLPRLRDEPEQYRQRLLDLLADQKSIVERHTRAAGFDRDSALRDEAALVVRINNFHDDFKAWAEGP